MNYSFRQSLPRGFLGIIVLGSLLAVYVSNRVDAQQQPSAGRAGPPAAKQAGGSRPSSLFRERTLHKPPLLAGSGPSARESVRAFIAWAGFSAVSEREDGRKVIADARENLDIAKALCEEATAARNTNHSRALVVLSILGEMRSKVGEECLRAVVRIPLPEKGTVTVEGENVEQTALAMLQAKAIDGLAYMHSATGDDEVLQSAAKHPSRIVRAEAIAAYLWNHGDSAEARTVLSKYIRQDERIFLDRVRKEPGEKAESFNRKLQAYLRAHPEVRPPAPQHEKKFTEPKRPSRPPAF